MWKSFAICHHKICLLLNPAKLSLLLDKFCNSVSVRTCACIYEYVWVNNDNKCLQQDDDLIHCTNWNTLTKLTNTHTHVNIHSVTNLHT